MPRGTGGSAGRFECETVGIAFGKDAVVRPCQIERNSKLKERKRDEKHRLTAEDTILCQRLHYAQVRQLLHDRLFRRRGGRVLRVCRLHWFDHCQMRLFAFLFPRFPLV